MLVRTRAAVNIAQPPMRSGMEEQEMFRKFCTHLRQSLQEVVERKVEPAEAAAAPSAAEPATATATETATSKAMSLQPVDHTARYEPTRWLLLSCYEATHGPGCALSRIPGAALTATRREGFAVRLFIRLTGATKLLPPSRHAAVDCRELYEEAVAVHRRAGSLGSLPSPNRELRRWLLEPPDAIAIDKPIVHWSATLGRHPQHQAAREWKANLEQRRAASGVRRPAFGSSDGHAGRPIARATEGVSDVQREWWATVNAAAK